MTCLHFTHKYRIMYTLHRSTDNNADCNYLPSSSCYFSRRELHNMSYLSLACGGRMYLMVVILAIAIQQQRATDDIHLSKSHG